MVYLLSMSVLGGEIAAYASRSQSPDSGKTSKKRKLGEISAPTEKSSKRKRKKKPRGRDLEDEQIYDDDLRLNKVVSHMSSGLLADHIAQRTKKLGSDLSVVELEDRRVSGKCSVD